jgi:hypothetical protein
MRLFCSFLIFSAFALISGSCEENNSSKKVVPRKKEKSVTPVEKETTKQILQETELEKSPVTVSKNTTSTRQKKSEKIKVPPTRNSFEKVTDSTDYYAIPEHWEYNYKKKKEWMDLHQTSQDAFIKGSFHAFRENVQLRPSKSEIIQRYAQKLEPLFHKTPSFIAFSVQRFRESSALDSLCRAFELKED